MKEIVYDKFVLAELHEHTNYASLEEVEKSFKELGVSWKIGKQLLVVRRTANGIREALIYREEEE